MLILLIKFKFQNIKLKSTCKHKIFYKIIVFYKKKIPMFKKIIANKF